MRETTQQPPPPSTTDINKALCGRRAPGCPPRAPHGLDMAPRRCITLPRAVVRASWDSARGTLAAASQGGPCSCMNPVSTACARESVHFLDTGADKAGSTRFENRRAMAVAFAFGASACMLEGQCGTPDTCRARRGQATCENGAVARPLTSTSTSSSAGESIIVKPRVCRRRTPYTAPMPPCLLGQKPLARHCPRSTGKSMGYTSGSTCGIVPASQL